MIIKVKAYAKINLFLNINGITENGYHILDSLMASINLSDELTISIFDKDKINEKDRKKFNANSSIKIIFLNSKEIDSIQNTAYKAALLFFEKYKNLTDNKYVCVKIKKKIPIGIGLGGSSADGAGVLLALCNYFSVPLNEIEEIALKVGSDVPFMLKGGFCRIKNIGELSSIEKFNKLNILLAKPNSMVNTTECYKKYDTLNEKDFANCQFSGFCMDENLLKKLNLEKIYNALTLPASLLNKDVELLYNAIKKCNPKAVVMTGSGSSVFGIFETKKECTIAKNTLQKQLQNVYFFVLATVKKGVTIS